MPVFFISTALAIAIDLWSKHAAFDYFETVSLSTPLIEPFLYFTRAENTGVAFGMLQGMNQILSYALPVILIGLPLYIYKHRHEPKTQLLLLGCIYGGALGNYYDRLNFGYVRDFIDVRLGSYHYPVFNIADAFISCSVILLFLISCFSPKSTKITTP